jgi:hypothetical protein
MNYDKVSQYAPPIIKWNSKRDIRFEEIDLWEVITEMTGPIGVYAAYMPYAEYYIVTNRRKIVAEFVGWNANKRLEEYLIQNNIPYTQTPDQTVSEFETTKSIFI